MHACTSIQSEFHKILSQPLNSPILIVDDSHDDRLLLSKYLDSFLPENTPVIPLNGGKDLLAYLHRLEHPHSKEKDFESAMPTMVFLDLLMPEMNGIAVLAALHMRSAWRDIPITMVSASQDNEFIKAAERAGINAFLPKPFTKFDIIRAMQRLHYYPPVTG